MKTLKNIVRAMAILLTLMLKRQKSSTMKPMEGAHRESEQDQRFSFSKT